MLPSPHRASASSSQATFAPSKQESSRQTNWLFPFIIVFAWLWRSIKWFWTTVILLLVANFFITLLTIGLNNGNDPRQWVVVLGAQEHLLTAGSILILATLLAFAAYRADHSQQMAAERKKASWQYIRKRVDHLDPKTDLAIEAYENQVYLPRDADTQAREWLHQAAQREDVSPLGICIKGRPALGKTRLIWEAVRAKLPSAMFIRWPNQQYYTLNYEAHRGKTVVLWLDDLHKFANPKDAPPLLDVPGYFERVGARLIVVTACREGNNWDEAGKHLGDLIARLKVVAPQDITPSDADHLTDC